MREKEPSISSLLIPQHIDNFPFPDPKSFSAKIQSGEFKGKIHAFVFDVETTGITRKELPRILEMCMEKVDLEKDFSEQVAASLKPSLMVLNHDEPATPRGGFSLADEKKDNYTPPPLEEVNSSETDTISNEKKFHTFTDPGIPSSIYAWDYHKINRSDVRGKPTIADTFPSLLEWVAKYGKAKPEDVCVILMPHFAKLEKITFAYELTRAKLEAPSNWVFVNATTILEKQLPEIEKVQLSSIFSHLFGSPPAKVHRADADVTTLKACLQKCFTNPEHFKEALVLEMANTNTKFI